MGKQAYSSNLSGLVLNLIIIYQTFWCYSFTFANAFAASACEHCEQIRSISLKANVLEDFVVHNAIEWNTFWYSILSLVHNEKQSFIYALEIRL